MKGGAICDLGAGPGPRAGFTGATGYVLCPCMLGKYKTHLFACRTFLLQEDRKQEKPLEPPPLAGADKQALPATPSATVPRIPAGAEARTVRDDCGADSCPGSPRVARGLQRSSRKTRTS